ncbi:MAG: cyclic nucleotide-binding domain-containing protein [Propionibacteriales bacterium]|nr:cyclic nucleotide-binding domain-containing protein [Propionibacteriales bacterium]
MRLHKDTKARLIRSLPLFADCTSTEIAEVAAIADELVLRPARVLARESAEGREFVVIVSGTATVHRGREPIATLEPGDFFGEIALLTGKPRTATVIARTAVQALVIEGHAFMTLLEHSPGIRAKVESALAERLPSAG